MSSQKLGLQRHQVAVSRCKVDNCFDTQVILDQTREGNATHAYPRHWTIGNVDAINTGFLKQRRTLEYFGRIQTFGGIEFDTYNTLSRRQLFLPACRRTLLWQAYFFLK